jgi:hypothetical protein
MNESLFASQQALQEMKAVANAVEISVEEIEARENAATEYFCCVLNVAF